MNRGGSAIVFTSEASPAIDQADLNALREGISAVLGAECTSQAVHAFIDGQNGLDAALWARAREFGWLAVGLPEQYGGLGLGVQGLDLLHQQLGRHMAPGPFVATLSAAQWILELGSDSQKSAYLPRIAAGDLSVAVPAAIGPASVDEIALLGAPDAGLAIIPTKSGWALVEPGDTLDVIPMWDRTRSVVRLRPNSVTPASIVMDPDGAAGRTLAQHVSLAVASDSVGAGRAIAEQTVQYMRMREQFGKPIGSFQALKHRAADLMALLATNDLLVEQAVTATAEASADAQMWAALAKAGAAEAFAFIAADCVQLHGGVGFTWEFDCHVFLKRARLNEALVGANAALRDHAADILAVATCAGRSTVELPTI